MVATFFGHREIAGNIEPIIKKTIIDLIENKGVSTFYVGNHGAFDLLVKKVLKNLKSVYTHISYAVVLAYMPTCKEKSADISTSVYPEGLERVPKKFAILKRNEWMLQQSEYVITFVTHTQGCAAAFQEKALKQNKTVINIAKTQESTVAK